MNVAIILENNKILLGMKKRGFGVGRWNGYGGKLNLEVDKDIHQCAIREFNEEAGIEVKDLETMGIIDFIFVDNPEKILEVHFIIVTDYSGVPVETDEMKPQWFDINEIPYSEMWPDDRYWMPLFLQGKKFRGSILFKDNNTIISNDIKEVYEI